MSSLPGTPASGPLRDIVRAAERLNPCLDLDADVLAVVQGAIASTASDWGSPAGAAVDQYSGAVRIAEAAPVVLFSNTANGSSVQHHFTDGQASSKGPEEYCVDVFPNPSVVGGVPFTLDSFDVVLGIQNGVFLFTGSFRISLYGFDADWNLLPLGDPIDIPAKNVTDGAVRTIQFRSGYGRRFVFAPGTLQTRTGAGRTSAGAARTVNQDATGASQLTVVRGLRVGITPYGAGFQYAWIGCSPTSSVAAFDPTSFWRYAPNRVCGPYNAHIAGANALDVNANPDGYLTTGAIPGYGAVADTNGAWGVARHVLTQGRGQDANEGWQRPYFALRAVAYNASATVSNVLQLGKTPTNPVQLRIDDWSPAGTSVAYTLDGSADGGTWTGLGVVHDGQILTGSGYLWKFYRLNATLTAGPTSGTHYASPALQAWAVVERVTLATYRYADAFDADSVVDPVTGQSSIAELTLTLYKPGRRDYRDLATRIASQYAPAQIEAHVYARNTRTGTRYFLNAYRMESRTPDVVAERLTFVAGMDRLTVTLPPTSETYRYPVAAGTQATVQSVSTPAAGYLTVQVSGTPFVAGALGNFRYHGVTGASAGVDFAIQANPYPNTTSTFTIPTTTTAGLAVATGQLPAAGDTFEIHSDQTSRASVAYSGADLGAILSDLVAVQAAVPARYVGQMPGTTGRTATNTLPADGVKGTDVTAAVALNCGGFLAWRRGRIDYVDLYSKTKDAVATWTPRHVLSLDCDLGMDRRMPSVRVKYGWNPSTEKFSNQSTCDDFDAVVGMGRANLFDVFEVPDDVCKWCDATQASYLVQALQQAWKSGVMLWKVETVFAYPYRQQGDAVAIVTDQFTGRRLSFSPDGITDNGQPVVGWVSALGVIIGMNLAGTRFIVAVRGIDAIASTTPQLGGIALPQMAAPDVQVSIGSTGGVTAKIIGQPGTVTAKAYLFLDAAVPNASVVNTSGTSTASSGRTGVAQNIGVVKPGQRYAVGAVAYDANGQPSALGIAGDTWDGVGILPRATIVIGTPQKQSDKITWPITPDASVTAFDVFELEETSDPGAAVSVESRANLRRSYVVGQNGVVADGATATSCGLPLVAPSNYQAITVVPYQGTNRGNPAHAYTQGPGAATTKPGAPSLSAPSSTSNSLSWTTTYNSAPVAATQYRVYLDGAAYSTVNIAGASQTLSVANATPGHTYQVQVSEVTSGGVEGPLSTALAITCATDTSGGTGGTGSNGKVPTPAVAASYDEAGGAVQLALTVSGAPSGTVWHTEWGTASSGPWTEDTGAASTSSPLYSYVDEKPTQQIRYYRVWGVCSGYAVGDRSTAAQVTIPATAFGGV